MTFDKIERKPAVWLWPGWIPKGAITIVEGNPETNKSTFTLDLAARLARGAEIPCDPNGSHFQPGRTAILTSEDSPECVIKGRLLAADADLDQSSIHYIDKIEDEKGSRRIRFPQDIDRLTQFLKDQKITLLIIDPLTSFIGNGSDLDKMKGAREVLDALAAMSEETGVALLIIRHWTKDREGKTAVNHRGGWFGRDSRRGSICYRNRP